jgi:hypothetical protein
MVTRCVAIAVTADLVRIGDVPCMVHKRITPASPDAEWQCSHEPTGIGLGRGATREEAIATAAERLVERRAEFDSAIPKLAVINPNPLLP